MKLRLKELRKARHLTQSQLAALAGISQSYYTELELGTKQINANRLQALATALGVAPQNLIEGSEANPASEILVLLDAMSEEQQALVLQLVRSLSTSS